MKSIQYTLLASILFFFSTNIASAQLGVKAGYNLSSLKYFSDNDENFNEEFISGYQVGLVYHAALGDALSFQPEVAYYTSGGNSDFLSSAIERSYQNLKVNALLNLNVIGSNDGIGLHVTGGLFAGYALSAKIKAAGTETTVNFDDDDDFNRTNVGYILGAGVKLNKFIVSVRGSFGVTELASFDGLGFTGDASIKSREFSLVGVLLF
jgi:opacity protein-like surface antigen